jgi:hypothetical protein
VTCANVGEEKAKVAGYRKKLAASLLHTSEDMVAQMVACLSVTVSLLSVTLQIPRRAAKPDSEIHTSKPENLVSIKMPHFITSSEKNLKIMHFK